MSLKTMPIILFVINPYYQRLMRIFMQNQKINRGWVRMCPKIKYVFQRSDAVSLTAVLSCGAESVAVQPQNPGMHWDSVWWVKVNFLLGEWALICCLVAGVCHSQLLTLSLQLVSSGLPPSFGPMIGNLWAP